MTENRCCGNCRWWLADPIDPNNLGAGGGTCHGGPPTAIIIVQRNAAGQVSQALSSAWPPVARTELPCAVHQFPLTKKEPA
jgi:hypothetical protein